MPALQLEDKLKDFKAENQLLGRVLQDAQVRKNMMIAPA